MKVLSLSGVTKHYGPIRALNNMSLEVPEGCIYGILGPNGSGKTTLLGIITDVLKADSGTYQFFESNEPNHKIRKHIGTLLETPNFYHYLTASQNLKIAAEIKGCGIDNINNVLKTVNLYERRNSKFYTYSLGMKQRLAIASALLANPKLLIFDEPTNGLDPEGIAEIRELIKKIASEGKTIIMASHLLDEVEKVCTHAAIIKKGNLITAGRVEEILSGNDVVEISARDIDKLANVIKRLVTDSNIEKTGDSLILRFEKGTANTEAINSFCFSHGVVVNKIILKKQRLETAFLELTNSNS